MYFAVKGTLFSKFQGQTQAGEKFTGLQFINNKDNGKNEIIEIKDFSGKYADLVVDNKEITIFPLTISQFNNNLYFKVIANAK